MRNYVAEALGTFAILFFGTGAAIVDSITGGTVSHVGISVTFGFTVMSMIYVFGDTSGAHFNPAVTIAFYFSGRFPGKEILPYVIAQLLGAIARSGLLLFLFPDAATRGEAVPSRDVLQAFVLEGVLTFFLMLTIIHVAHGSKEQGMFAGLAIGSVVLMAALFAGPICGASMNPARSLAPALMSGNLQSIWIYLTAPVLGAVGAVLGWKWLRR